MIRFRQPAHSRKPVPILRKPLPAITFDWVTVKLVLDDDTVVGEGIEAIEIDDDGVIDDT